MLMSPLPPVVPSFSPGAPDLQLFRQAMAEAGVVRFPGLLDPGVLPSMRADCDAVYCARRAVQERNGVAAGMAGAAHHALGDNTSLDRFLDALPLWEEIGAHFGGKFILLNFGATLHPPGGDSYAQKPHRDVRAWTGHYPLSLNMLVMLDDFTVENGATLFLPGSHRTEAMPPPDAFAAAARQVCGKAGDVLLFDSLVVHGAAPNRGASPRRALTLCFGRPFMKPQMDWPRFLPAGAEDRVSPRARQLLGYHARVPASLDEYYQPPERWTFRPDQR